jgi:hypothetical protein
MNSIGEEGRNTTNKYQSASGGPILPINQYPSNYNVRFDREYYRKK